MGCLKTIRKLRDGQLSAISVSSYRAERARVAQTGCPAPVFHAVVSHGFTGQTTEGALVVRDTPSTSSVEGGWRRGHACPFIAAATPRRSRLARKPFNNSVGSCIFPQLRILSHKRECTFCYQLPHCSCAKKIQPFSSDGDGAAQAAQACYLEQHAHSVSIHELFAP